MNNERKTLQESVDAVKMYGSVSAAAKEMGIARKTLSGRYNKAIDKGYVPGTPVLSPEQEIGLDSKLKVVAQEKRELQAKYNELLKLYDVQAGQFHAIKTFNTELDFEGYDKIKVVQDGKSSESTAVILCSDLHYEEVIDSDKVDGLNEYNTTIAAKRFHKLFQNSLRLIQINRHGANIKQCVVWFGGDLINGYIHDEMIENNAMSPIEASLEVFKLCMAGIDFLVEQGGFEKITVVTSIGNHARTTQKMRITTSAENSYEYLIYNFLASHYEKSGIVKFKLSRGYFNWLSIYGYDIRFHHGENVRYAGGVGGITIPLNKAIAQWNQGKSAYLDVLGHWHQVMSMKNAVINGSIVGYGPYALSIKAAFEKPQQFMFLMHPKYGRTVQCPIFVTE